MLMCRLLLAAWEELRLLLRLRVQHSRLVQSASLQCPLQLQASREQPRVGPRVPPLARLVLPLPLQLLQSILLLQQLKPRQPCLWRFTR